MKPGYKGDHQDGILFVFPDFRVLKMIYMQSVFFQTLKRFFFNELF